MVPEVKVLTSDPSKEKLGDKLGNCPETATSSEARQRIAGVFI